MTQMATFVITAEEARTIAQDKFHSDMSEVMVGVSHAAKNGVYQYHHYTPIPMALKGRLESMGYEISKHDTVEKITIVSWKE